MSSPLSALPRCVALRSKHDNSSYLRSVHDESHGGSLIELGGDGGGVMNPRCRFYLEPSKEHEGLVHVRCCYNNKYWVPQQRVLHSGGARSVIGTADEPEEDLSKPSCTLLKLTPIVGKQAEDGSTFRFLHSKLGKYACVPSTPLTSIRSYMHVASHEDEVDRQDSGGLIDAFALVDVSRQKQLTTYLAFKGDNGCFLVGEETNKDKLLHFSGQDIGDPRALHTIFTNDGGVVRIKSNSLGLFWQCESGSISSFNPLQNWISASSDDTTHNDRGTLFTVTTGDDFIALRNLGNNNFCRRLTGPWHNNMTWCINGLNAAVESITTEAKLQCHEPVMSRDIYDVDFRLSEARMYTKGIDDLYSQTVKNHSGTTNKTTLTFTYTSTVATTWSSTVSVKILLSVGSHLLLKGKLRLALKFSGSYTWGKTETEQKQISKQITVDIPPMKKVTVKAIGSNGVCDIPFSYKQRDALLNGQEVIHEFTDGMYFGVKTSNITFDTTEENL